MEVSKSTCIAMAVMIHLAKSDGKRETIKDIAKTLKINFHSTQKAVQALRKHGFVDTKYGVYGGIKLIGEPREITMGRIFLALEKMKYPRKELIWIFRIAYADWIRALNEQTLYDMLEAE